MYVCLNLPSKSKISLNDYLIRMTSVSLYIFYFSARVFAIENQLMPSHTHFSALTLLDICMDKPQNVVTMTLFCPCIYLNVHVYIYIHVYIGTSQ